MVRLALLITVLAGCDQVFGLERGPIDPNADEDLDGVLDVHDGCPHIPDQPDVDDDGDGVPAACDPDDEIGDTKTMFFNLDGALPPSLVANGHVSVDADGTIELGSAASGLDSIVVDQLTTQTVLIDIGYEILENKIEDIAKTYAPTDYAEIGLYTARRSIPNDRTMRGNVCFFGTNPASPVLTQPLYIETDEDAGNGTMMSQVGRFDGTTGRMRLVRTPDKAICTVLRDGDGQLSASVLVQNLKTASGTVAVSSDATRVKLHYIFVAYQ